MSSFGKAVKQRALRVRPTPAIEKHLSKAFGHYVRIQILWVLNERIASASELADELSTPLNTISGHLRVLREAECIEIVDQVIVGNAVQKFYKATARVFFDDTEWRTIPPTLKEGLRITLLQNLIDDSIESLEQELYDSVEGSHMSWTPMVIDELGREELTKLFDTTLKRVLEIQRRAAERLSVSNGEGIGYSASILAYPSIAGLKKINPAKAKKASSAAKKSTARKKTAKKGESQARGRASKKNKTPGKAQARKRRRSGPKD